MAGIDPDSDRHTTPAPSRLGRIVAFPFLVATAAVSLLNGLPSSPLFDSAMFYLSAMTRGWLASGDFLFHLNTVVLGLVTLFAAGVPAAIYEGWRQPAPSPVVSGIIWLLAAAALATPGILGWVGYFDIE